MFSGAIATPFLLPEAIAEPLEDTRKRVEGQCAEEIAKDDLFDIK